MQKQQAAREALLNTEEMLNIKAHQTGNLKHFLIKYFLFRAYIVFKNGKRMHLYGNEHQCTYSQLKHSRFENIKMDRHKGYGELIDLIERKYKAQYKVAKIYRRNPGDKSFSSLCRYYNANGELEECKDPLLTDQENILTLYYYFKNGCLVISETDPSAEDFTINL